jgi:hypothetical protein
MPRRPRWERTQHSECPGPSFARRVGALTVPQS